MPNVPAGYVNYTDIFSVNFSYDTILNDYEKKTMPLNRANYNAIQNWCVDNIGFYFKDFSINICGALSMLVRKKPIKITGNDVFSFDGYNGYYSINGIDRISEKTAKYRYSFYAFVGINAFSLMNEVYNSYNLQNENNRFAFMQSLGVDLGTTFVQLSLVSVIDNLFFKPWRDIVIFDKKLRVPISAPNLKFKYATLFFFPPEYIADCFGGKLETIRTSNNTYQYVSDISTGSLNCFSVLNTYDDYLMSLELANKFDSNLLQYSSISNNDNWLVQYCFPWFRCKSSYSPVSRYNVDMRIPVLIDKNSPNIMSSPTTPFVSWVNIDNMYQTFSIIFPFIEVIK